MSLQWSNKLLNKDLRKLSQHERMSFIPDLEELSEGNDEAAIEILKVVCEAEGLNYDTVSVRVYLYKSTMQYKKLSEMTRDELYLFVPTIEDKCPTPNDPVRVFTRQLCAEYGVDYSTAILKELVKGLE